MMWNKAPDHFRIEKEQVHVWKADVALFEVHFNHFIKLLSKDEQERAAKFRFQKDRLTYVLGKGILRTLLSKYLKINSICFKYNNQSKPFIENSINLKFNVSHSHKTLTFAFTLENDIGVDIEYNKRSIEIPQIAKRFFSKNEATELLALKKNEWLPTFYNCWTRKEAFIKAKGGGLSIPLDQFEVSILSNENVELKVIQWDQNDVKNWKMEAFNCRGDYTGATIVNSSNSIFYYYDCDSLSII